MTDRPYKGMGLINSCKSKAHITLIVVLMLVIMSISACGNKASLIPETPTASGTAQPSATEKPDETLTPAVTEQPTATARPVITEAAELTDRPNATEAPEVTETPGVTGTPEVTETPGVTGTPEVTETPDVTGTPEVTETPDVTGTPEATGTPGATETPAATATPAPTNTPTSSPTAAATATPSPTAIPVATKEPTATPQPTSTPKPTATPGPTATPKPTATPTPTPVPYVIPTGLNAAQVAQACSEVPYNPNPYNGYSDSKAVDIAAEIIIQNLIKPGMEDHEKVKVIHDYLVEYSTYDYINYLNGTIPYASYYPEGCLLRHYCVCDGYARSFRLLMDKLNIDCVKVVGWADNGKGFPQATNHAWNQVKLDGEWYYIDVTWDDPVWLKEDGSIGQEERSSYKYFLVPSEIMSLDHRDSYAEWSERPGCSELHACNSRKYYEYYKTKVVEEQYPGVLICDSRDDAVNKFKEAVKAKSDQIILYWPKNGSHEWNNDEMYSIIRSAYASYESSGSSGGTAENGYFLIKFYNFVSFEQAMAERYPEYTYLDDESKIEDYLLKSADEGQRTISFYLDAKEGLTISETYSELYDLSQKQRKLLAEHQYIVTGVDYNVNAFYTERPIYVRLQLKIMPEAEYAESVIDKMLSEYRADGKNLVEVTDFESIKSALAAEAPKNADIYLFSRNSLALYTEIYQALNELDLKNYSYRGMDYRTYCCAYYLMYVE